MANSLYDKGREAFLRGTIAWQTGPAKVALLRGATFSNAHEFLADIVTAGGTIVARSNTIANPTTTAGVADGDDVTFGSVATGAAITAMVIYIDLGSDATNKLVGWIDTATNLPVTPDNGTISVQWDNTANRIFKL
jgi:hypothetical protein